MLAISTVALPLTRLSSRFLFEIPKQATSSCTQGIPYSTQLHVYTVLLLSLGIMNSGGLICQQCKEPLQARTYLFLTLPVETYGYRF